MDLPTHILYLIITFFGQPVVYMNASPYLTVEGCMKSSEILTLPEDPRVGAKVYCEWRDATPESVPKLTTAFTDEQMDILTSIGWWEKTSE